MKISKDNVVVRCLREAKKNSIKFLLCFLLTLVYASLGAILFYYIEHCYDVVPAKLSFAEEILKRWCQAADDMMRNASTANTSLFMNFTADCERYKDGTEQIFCKLTKNAFVKWFKYTMATIYTIGYGNIVPQSDLGKIVTMLYAIPGIVFAVGSYIPAAKGLVALTQAIIHTVEIKCFKIKEVKHCEIKVLIIQLCFFAIMLFCIAGWVTIDELENYRFLDGVYYAFVTMTTIGFGDFDWKFELYFDKPHYFVLTATFFLTGLGLFASLITSIGHVAAKYSPTNTQRTPRTERKDSTVDDDI